MQKLLCTNCETEFKPGAWYNCEGNPTRKHVVKAKTYYSESDSYCVNAIPQSSMVGNQGERINIPGKIVTFHTGVYVTTDPELQEVLDREAPMTRERYMEMRMTPELKTGRDRAIISQQQALIDELKAKNAELQKQVTEPEEEADAVMAGAGGGRPKRKAANAAKN